MNNRKLIISIGVLIAMLIAGYFLFWQDEDRTSDNETNTTSDTYMSDEFGFSFERPDGYEILEVTDETTGRHSIVLSRTEDSSIPVDGEGPRAITIDVFPEVAESDVTEWLRANNSSNYNLIRGEAKERAVDGESGAAYSWDGLYLGRSVAVLHEGSIILVSGTYLEEDDAIYSDFDKVVNSISLE